MLIENDGVGMRNYLFAILLVFLVMNLKALPEDDDCVDGADPIAIDWYEGYSYCVLFLIDTDGDGWYDIYQHFRDGVLTEEGPLFPEGEEVFSNEEGDLDVTSYENSDCSSGETKKVLILKGISQYQCSFNCDGSLLISELKIENSTDIANEKLLVSNIYPNPVYDYVDIQLSDLNPAKNRISFMLYSVTGQPQTQVAASINGLNAYRLFLGDDMPSGIYFIKIIIDNNDKTFFYFVKE